MFFLFSIRMKKKLKVEKWRQSHPHEWLWMFRLRCQPYATSHLSTLGSPEKNEQRTLGHSRASQSNCLSFLVEYSDCKLVKLREPWGSANNTIWIDGPGPVLLNGLLAEQKLLICTRR